MVDFPHPLPPTNAIVSPCLASNDRPFRIGASDLEGYPKQTPRKEMLPDDRFGFLEISFFGEENGLEIDGVLSTRLKIFIAAILAFEKSEESTALCPTTRAPKINDSTILKVRIKIIKISKQIFRD